MTSTYIGLTPVRRTGKRPAAVVKADFESAREAVHRDGVALPCHNDTERWSDYELHGGRPSPEQAKAMCAPCPLLHECREWANTTRPGWSVWGGVVWRYGKPLRDEDEEISEIVD